jgi:uncharacterized protein with HEPN domain
MNEFDRIRLLDMLDSGRNLVKALESKSRTDLEDFLTGNAVIHVIALIGEAASQIGKDTREAYPELDWKNMIGMRNFVIHHYHRVTLDVVWDTATHDIPKLIAQLEVILGDTSSNQSP